MTDDYFINQFKNYKKIKYSIDELIEYYQIELKKYVHLYLQKNNRLINNNLIENFVFDYCTKYKDFQMRKRTYVILTEYIDDGLFLYNLGIEKFIQEKNNKMNNVVQFRTK